MKIIILKNLPIIAIISILALSFFFFFRVDLTSDKRFSISTHSKRLMEKATDQIDIVIYLDGDLNPGFLRLKKSTVELLEELSVYAEKPFNIRFENPSFAESQELRNANYTKMVDDGMTPTIIYERDKEGKSIEKVIFPWVKITHKNKRVAVSILKNIRGNSGEENLNISIENLEFEITDGIRQLLNTEVSKIAFIEGHGELSEAETFDISKSLSRYFQIDRGVLGLNPSILNDYKVIIIAKPTLPFSESDKYIIDQYIMNGGSVLWLLDQVRLSTQSLSKSGLSPALALDLNLNDMLFKYGVRINPVILQDVQSVQVPINIAPANSTPQFEPTPWYYGPLLLTSSFHAVSRNITEVKAEFCSSIEIVGENNNVKAQLLLATSDNTHIIGTPTTIDLSVTPKANDKTYFNLAYIPVAVALDGNFESVFTNRLLPKELTNTSVFKEKSYKTRQIFIADGDIIRNDTNKLADDGTTIPLGFDRYMNQQFGNKDFILNSVLYLADNDGRMELRNRTLKLRLLNKQISTSEKAYWQWINIVSPLMLLLIFGIIYQVIRKRKYTK